MVNCNIHSLSLAPPSPSPHTLPSPFSAINALQSLKSKKQSNKLTLPSIQDSIGYVQFTASIKLPPSTQKNSIPHQKHVTFLSALHFPELFSTKVSVFIEFSQLPPLSPPPPSLSFPFSSHFPTSQTKRRHHQDFPEKIQSPPRQSQKTKTQHDWQNLWLQQFNLKNFKILKNLKIKSKTKNEDKNREKQNEPSLSFDNERTMAENFVSESERWWWERQCLWWWCLRGSENC